MIEKITMIAVTCRDGSSDPVVERVDTQTLGVELPPNREAEALGFSFIPGITKLSEILAHGWVKAEKKLHLTTGVTCQHGSSKGSISLKTTLHVALSQFCGMD